MSTRGSERGVRWANFLVGQRTTVEVFPTQHCAEGSFCFLPVKDKCVLTLTLSVKYDPSLCTSCHRPFLRKSGHSLPDPDAPC